MYSKYNGFIKINVYKFLVGILSLSFRFLDRYLQRNISLFLLQLKTTFMSSFLFSPRKDLRETARSLYRKMRTISFVKYFHYCLQLYRMWQQGCLADCLNSTPRQSFPHCRPLFPHTRINLNFF